MLRFRLGDLSIIKSFTTHDDGEQGLNFVPAVVGETPPGVGGFNQDDVPGIPILEILAGQGASVLRKWSSKFHGNQYVKVYSSKGRLDGTGEPDDPIDVQGDLDKPCSI